MERRSEVHAAHAGVGGFSKTQVFRIRNLLLKWRREAAVMDARQPKITQLLSTTARDPGSARGAASRLTTQQTQAGARATRSRRREASTSRTAALQNTVQRRVRGAPNGDNDADQAPSEDDLAAEDDMLGSTIGASRDGMMTDTGHEADASGALEAGIDLGWLPKPGRTQALSGRAAACCDFRRCAFHSPPYMDAPSLMAALTGQD